MPLLLILLSTIIILGSLFFYLYALTNGVILFMLVIVLVFVIFLAKRSSGLLLSGLGARTGTVPPQAESEGGSPSGLAGAARKAKGQPLERFIFLIPLAAAFYILFTHQTTQALRSPWEVIPPSFFLLYGISVFLLLRSQIYPLRPTNDSGSGAAAVRSEGMGDPEREFSSRRSRDEGHSGRGSRSKASYNVARRWSVLGAAEGWSWLPITLLTFLTLSISLFIFPLGAGFDPFIHQATEKIIAATGTITPKPLYYIGQYTLVVFLSKILGISVVWIDKLLVPLLASILLPWSIMHWWKNRERSGAVLSSGIADQSGHGSAEALAKAESDERQAVSRRAGAASEAREDAPGRSITIFSFLLLPFLLAPFTTTTPYSLALLFLVVLIFSVQRLASSVQLLLAAATLLVHPLVGIPAFIFLIVIKTLKHKNTLLRAMCYVLCALAIPAAFFVASQLSSQISIAFAPQNFIPWLQSLSWGGIYRENRFNAPLDLLYFYGFNIKNIFLFFVFTAFLTKIKRWRQSGAVLSSGIADQSGHGSADEAESDERQAVSGRAGAANEAREDAPEWRQKSYLLTFLILLTSYVLMSGFLSFNFLIGYEQADYAKRVLDIAQLFLLPLFLLGIHWWFARIPHFVAIILFTLGITASLFLTYPQKVDSYSVSHAFNTSQADIDAVRWIDVDAHGEDYIVLANQAVSAAAIRELGFKKYYAPVVSSPLSVPSIFFYPIPTSSPLYKYYLDMVYQKASAETMQKSMQLVNVNRAYFVLNRYWNDFDRIFAEAQKNLHLLHSINNSVFIFFTKK